MRNSPSIYVLRRGVEGFPSRDNCSEGDVVILTSGDVLVWSELTWVLLPGRYLTVDELKEFIKYVASGWPEDPATFLSDLSELIGSKDFLTRASGLCRPRQT